ncbi:MAG: glycosyltransferase family 2 protein [Saprospiraceae bacterium]|nr:glycosyltransferase family 2 protein [Saprospiraceae bacterium]
MHPTLISILLPVYNAGDYLAPCLDSILAQSESNWELVAVDDCSTDQSWEVLQRYAAGNPRVRCYRNTTKGLIPALRLAFQQSKGDLITRMDDDDLMPPAKLAILKQIMLKNSRNCVATGLVRYFSDSALGEGYRRYEDWINYLALNQNHFSAIYKECPLPSPSWMMRREDLLDVGAFDSDTYPEDYDLCFRLYKYGKRIIAAPEVVHLWRDHPGRASRTELPYADNTFLDLKLRYFVEIDYQPQHPLVIWGAGRKGKAAAQFLSEKMIPFHWVCDNPRKWGKGMFGAVWQDYRVLSSLENPQVIILVAAPDEQPGIAEFLSEIGGQGYWFC